MNKSHIRKLFFIISVFIIVLLIAPVHAVWAGQPAQTVPTQAPTKTDTAVVYYYTLTFTPYVVTATPSFTPTVTDTETETDTLEPSASPTDTAQPTDTGQPLFTLTPPARCRSQPLPEVAAVAVGTRLQRIPFHSEHRIHTYR
jgi:hypothetical protein